ncbi:VOC family protein [Altererythrobacter sp. B11]|uniref:VOC family protein n=1 Tax=Altererythrobacter sp. B11 TaxID=2060312 RepID=UPI000E5BE62C|nr:VOC family protein [Altererythrobacter sp. B11]
MRRLADIAPHTERVGPRGIRAGAPANIRRLAIAPALGAAFLPLYPPIHAEEVPAMSTPAPLVFFDIAAPDLVSQRSFYGALLGWDIADDGSFTVPVQGPLPGTLRVEPADLGPLTERVLYFGVDDIEATQRRAVELGGGIAFPRLVVPGVVILAMLTDPAGNRFGVVEMSGGAVTVPPAPDG